MASPRMDNMDDDSDDDDDDDDDNFGGEPRARDIVLVQTDAVRISRHPLPTAIDSLRYKSNQWLFSCSSFLFLAR
jgi:hypothetical protein